MALSSACRIPRQVRAGTLFGSSWPAPDDRKASLRRVRGELQLGQPRIDAAFADKALMRSLLDQAPMVEHEDAVGADDGGKPVRNDEGGAAFHDLVERALHECLALRIERARRL